jgi:5-methylcytosine-specific restriction protein A
MLILLAFAMDFFIAAPPEHQRREKMKARELRASPWWKNQLAKGECHHCGQRFHPSELTMDHLIPVARGGFSKKGNVVPSCKPCNTEKGYKTALDSAFEELQSRENSIENSAQEEPTDS